MDWLHTLWLLYYRLFKKNLFILFIYFWLRWVFVAACSLFLVAASRLLIVVASLVAEHGL